MRKICRRPLAEGGLGMSEEEVRAAIEARAAGYNGGMPPGARISEEAAIERWLQGERAYMRIPDPLKRVGAIIFDEPQ